MRYNAPVMNAKTNEIICKLLDVYQVTYIVGLSLFAIWFFYQLLTTD